MQTASANSVTTGALALGLLLLMSLAGGVFRGVFLGLLLYRLVRIALPLSLVAGGAYWLAHLFG